jgi:hypothetical protein
LREAGAMAILVKMRLRGRFQPVKLIARGLPPEWQGVVAGVTRLADSLTAARQIASFLRGN